MDHKLNKKKTSKAKQSQLQKPIFIGIYPVFMLFPNQLLAQVQKKKNASNACPPANTCFPVTN